MPTLRRKYGLDIERQLVRKFREKGGYSERRPRSLGGTDVLRIYDNEVWLIQSKTTSKSALYIKREEVEKLLRDRDIMRRNLSKFEIPIKAVFYVARVISPSKGKKARRIGRYLEVSEVKGETLKVQFEPHKVEWLS
ncbi:MAG: hypothetical protein QXL67_05395 [Candidatus Bathyarchaeia archaeon]